ncbi:MAG TPA: type II toxin-antitoxin system HicA family toxin [Thermoanaerobaculia bacterium]
MKRRDLMNWLSQHGCELVREGSRHSWWRNPAARRHSAVPRHTEIEEFLVRKICRDLGIPSPDRPDQIAE